MTSPDRPDVDGSYDHTNIGELANITEENYRMMMANKVTGGFFQNRDLLFGDGFLGGIAKALGTGDFPSPFTSIREGAEASANALIGGIADAIRGDGGARFAPIRQAWVDGQLALNNRLDLLSPLLDYGSVYSEGESWLGRRIMKFDQQIGPMRGCEIVEMGVDGVVGAGIRLLDKGVWDIRCQLTVSWVTAVNQQNVNVSIVVHNPDGSWFHETAYRMPGTTDTSTISFMSSVVVPGEGYMVSVQVTSISPVREILGGAGNTRLTVQHISRSITDQI